jgi:hypothetical protein
MVDNKQLAYDAGLVGRRCTAWCEPEEGTEFVGGYYAATIVAFNARAHARCGRFLLHFDTCGQRERVELPDDTVRVMTAQVTRCSCVDSPRGTPGCSRGATGSQPLPRPWESHPE